MAFENDGFRLCEVVMGFLKDICAVLIVVDVNIICPKEVYRFRTEAIF